MRRLALLLALVMSAAAVSGCRTGTASTVPYPPSPLVEYETTAVIHPDVIAPPGPPSTPATWIPFPEVPTATVDVGLDKAFIDRIFALYHANDALGVMALMPTDRKTLRYIEDDYGDGFFAKVQQQVAGPPLKRIPDGYANWRIALSWRIDPISWSYIYDEPGLPYVVYRVFFYLESPVGGETNAYLDMARDRRTRQWYYLPLVYGKYQRNIGGNPADPAYDNITWRYLEPPR